MSNERRHDGVQPMIVLYVNWYQCTNLQEWTDGQLTNMATAMPEDHLTCSICLEVYNDPVSIPCGHNFCKSCLSRHWADKEQRLCPLCKDTSDKELKLRVNTELREIVEKFKKQNEKADGTSPIKPGQVPCDCCPGKKTRASKTCLVCLVSYCDKHLENHLKIDAFKGHKLTKPVHKLEDKICKKHNHIQEFFCRDDQIRVCALCTEHSDHDTVHLDEKYVDKSYHMGKKREVVQETKPKKAVEIKDAAQKKQKGGRKPNRAKSNQTTPPGHKEASQHRNGRTCFPQVAGFSEDIFLFEFNVEDRAVCHLGVVRISTFRRQNLLSNHSDGNWVITLLNDGRIKRVCMCLDQKNRVLLFSNADCGDIICSFFDCEFRKREELFIFYDPGQPLSWQQRIQRYVQKKVEERDVSFFVSITLITLLWYVLAVFSF
nr:E3 ubiquitin/ISG15 ligase TRIM25 isoform X2 [Nothobranchius furzeri]